MKSNNKFNSGIMVNIALAIVAISISSCDKSKKEAHKDDFALVRDDSESQKGSRENDEKFLIEAAKINLEEISLGQLAQQKSSRSEVKELGKMMENQHTASQDELTDLAKSKAITIPLELDNQAMKTSNELKNKSEADFNKSYSALMVNGHQKAIDLFEKASKESLDSDVKKWAENTLPTLRLHLQHAESCKETCDKM